jgi:hypothetical protein
LPGGNVWSVINGAHVLVYSTDPDADRALLRDVLRWPYVEDMASGGGWLIFKLPPTELGVHPTAEDSMITLHLMCDDIAATVRSLREQGVEPDGPITDIGYGTGTSLTLPGGARVGLYQPRHEVALHL